jgi:predicted acylesterase/phospholipase RssA
VTNANDARILPKGLVLAGGGVKGAYQFGCLRAFRERSLKFDAVSGTSVGALNAILWATNQLEKGSEIWTTLEQKRFMPWILPAPLMFLVIPVASFLQTTHLILSSGIPDETMADWRVLRLIQALMFYPFGVAMALSSSVLWSSSRTHIATLLVLVLGAVYSIVLGHLATEVSSRGVNFAGALLSGGLTFLLGVLWVVALGVAWLRTGANPFAAIQITAHNIQILLLLVQFALLAAALIIGGSLASATMGPLSAIVDDILKKPLTCLVYVASAQRSDIWDPDSPEWTVAPDNTDSSVPALKAIYVPRYRCLNMLDRDEQVKAVVASASLPFGVVKPVWIGGQELVDGGVVDNEPVFPLVELCPCDEIVIVRLAHGDKETWLREQQARWSRLERRIRLADYVVDMRQERKWYSYTEGGALPTRGPNRWPSMFRQVVPQSPIERGLSGGTLRFDPKYAELLLKQGQLEADVAMSEWPGH